jgi:carboxyl-terminal processing protease
MKIVTWTAALLLGKVFLSTVFLTPPSAVLGQEKDGTVGGAAATLTAEQRKSNLESFEYVWKTIRDKHFDSKLGGLDWQAVHEELQPQMEQADTMAKSREILTKMIQRLGQSHFSIIPRDAYQEMKKGPANPGNPTDPKKPADASSAGRAVPGFDVRVVEGQALVLRLDDGLPAAKAGVRPGWQVLAIEGTDLKPALDKVRETSKDSSYLEYRLMTTVLSRLRGNLGSQREIKFRDGDDKEITLRIPLAQPQGTLAQFGHLPPFYVSYQARKLNDNIGYFRLSAFFDPVNVMKAFEAAVKENLQADGFVLDLRGNPGGIGFMAVGIGNWFVHRPDQKLGTMTTREGELKFVLNPRAETFGGPLAILVDGCSMSTSEILAGGLQDLKRARVFGTPTAGAALPSQVERLPNGDGFQYAFASYVSAGEKPLEGVGVRPDQVIAPNRKALLDGHDAALDAALAWIRSQKKKPQAAQADLRSANAERSYSFTLR